MKMLRFAQIDEMDPGAKSNLDIIFDNLEKKNPEHIAVKQWKIFKSNNRRDQNRILTSLAAKLSVFDLATVEQITETDDLELDKMKDQKVILFITVPAIDDSYDFFADLLHFQLLTMSNCDCISKWNENLKNAESEKRSISEFLNGKTFC